jgi:hypothetical protein
VGPAKAGKEADWGSFPFPDTYSNKYKTILANNAHSKTSRQHRIYHADGELSHAICKVDLREAIMILKHTNVNCNGNIASNAE